MILVLQWLYFKTSTVFVSFIDVYMWQFVTLATTVITCVFLIICAKIFFYYY